jgi:hypothetical protein
MTLHSPVPRSSRPARSARDLVGRDLARVRLPRARSDRLLAGLLLGGLLAGLGLAALRIDILRLRYALAEAVEAEQALLGEQNVWTARSAALADPARLAELARQRGFERPSQVIDLESVRMAARGRP